MKVSLPDKRTASGKRTKDWEGSPGQPHWSVLAFFGPVALLQEHTHKTRMSIACFIHWH